MTVLFSATTRIDSLDPGNQSVFADANLELIKGKQDELGKIARLRELMQKRNEGSLNEAEEKELQSLSSELGIYTLEECSIPMGMVQAQIIRFDNEFGISEEKLKETEEESKENTSDIFSLAFSDVTVARKFLGCLKLIYDKLSIKYESEEVVNGPDDIQINFQAKMPEAHKTFNPLTATKEDVTQVYVHQKQISENELLATKLYVEELESILNLVENLKIISREKPEVEKQKSSFVDKVLQERGQPREEVTFAEFVGGRATSNNIDAILAKGPKGGHADYEKEQAKETEYKTR